MPGALGAVAARAQPAGSWSPASRRPPGSRGSAAPAAAVAVRHAGAAIDVAAQQGGRLEPDDGPRARSAGRGGSGRHGQRHAHDGSIPVVCLGPPDGRPAASRRHPPGGVQASRRDAGRHHPRRRDLRPGAPGSRAGGRASCSSASAPRASTAPTCCSSAGATRRRPARRPTSRASSWPARSSRSGRGVQRFEPGDRVMAVVAGGGQAELAVVHERAAMPVPGGARLDRRGRRARGVHDRPRRALHPGRADGGRAAAGPRRGRRRRHGRASSSARWPARA